jgi:hypothetical protein
MAGSLSPADDAALRSRVGNILMSKSVFEKGVP